MQELAAPSTTVSTELETEEVFITLHHNYFQSILVCIVFEMLGWSLSCTESLIFLSADEILAQEERTSLVNQKVRSHFFTLLACSAVSAVLRDYHSN